MSLTTTETKAVPGWLTAVLAFACALIVANIYYAQPLVGPISASLGLSPQAAGLIVTVTQLGYGAGLLLIVPLGDLMENRRLVLLCLAGTVAALMGAALSPTAGPFLVSAAGIGVCCVAVQVLVPYAAHLAPEASRGRVVGNVMSGVMLGIMLARPVSSFIASVMPWHAVFGLSAAAMAVLAVALRFLLPERRPAAGLHYGALLASMITLLRDTPVLQRRAAYHVCMFGAFSLFWTVVPLHLAHAYGLTQAGIAWFALAGVAGAVCAPLAGRLADRGWSHRGTGVAMATVAAALLLSRWGLSGTQAGLAVLVVAAIVLDAGVTAALIFSQRAIFVLGPATRSRLNGLFMAIFFMGGAAASALGAWTYAQGGWSLTVWAGLALPAAALALYATERVR